MNQNENVAKEHACRNVDIELELLDHEAMQRAIRSERFIGALH